MLAATKAQQRCFPSIKMIIDFDKGNVDQVGCEVRSYRRDTPTTALTTKALRSNVEVPKGSSCSSEDAPPWT